MNEKLRMNNQTNLNIDTVIIGLGVTGLSCARFLGNRGLSFAVMDTRKNPPGLEKFRQENPDVFVTVGDLDLDLIMTAKQCLVSPGISIRHPALVRAQLAGVEIIGDIELFARYIETPTIAITGANGKSTVTTLVFEMAKSAGLNVRAGGNLGTPALDLIGENEPELYVLELSSFQLETTHSLDAVAATVLNISEDHMDRYADVADYIDAKERIFQGGGEMILNADDPIVDCMTRSNRKTTRFTLDKPAENEFGVRSKNDQPWLAFEENLLMPISEMKIQGTHNIANALAALALGKAGGLETEPMLEVLKTWPGLPHRCEWVAEHNDVDWYNDSKGTNEGATVAAIKGFEQRPIILIAGGDAKGAKFEELAVT
ncbi:MAG: UDP-N-acetylmuramoyl-L-alanine--D-glutamate ligase, partial [Gammaproteobacteria bacterium]